MSLHLARVLFPLLAIAPLAAQIVQPIGRISPNARPLAQVATIDVPALDRNAIAAEDVQRFANGMPTRFAIPTPLAATPATNGSWDVLDATWSLWRVRVRAPNASHVNVGFTRFHPPATARVMVYSSDYSDIVRPFDATDATPDGQLWTPVVGTAEIVVEVYVQTAQRPQLDLQIGQVGSGYRYFGAGPTAVAPPEPAGACNIDVACPQAIPWLSEVPAIAAISINGSLACSGSMVNNTAQDGRNFFLTAHHCGLTTGNASTLVCYWNYQFSQCGGGTSSMAEFTSGSTLRADYSVSDFTLVELSQTPNVAWGISHAGWDHTGNNGTSGAVVHHPQVLEKKISFYTIPTQTTSYGGTTSPGDGTHVRVVSYSAGTTEPGSSGSPLFDQNHHILGQLHGGPAACGNTSSDYYGRFYVSWTGGGTNATRLSNWLDPLNTGQLALDTLPSTAAQATPFGLGCYAGYRTFYEMFSTGSFDMSGSATTARVVTLTPSGGSYHVANGTSAWFNSTSANLGLGDDTVSGVLAMPFSFTFPGGVTSQLRMCSNGYVWLNGTSTAAEYQPAGGTLVAEPARMCPFWVDLDPSSGGSTHYDVDPSGQTVYCTWLGVPYYGQASPVNDIQLALRSNGVAEFRWRVAGSAPTPLVVGFSPGNGALDPGSTDIDLAMPFQTAAADSPGLALAPLSRPVLGTNAQMQVQNIPAGTLVGALFLDFTQYSPGLSLAGIGMPGCFEYCGLGSSVGIVNPGATWPYNLPVPNVPTYSGLHVYAQAATLSAGVNAFGALATNGLDLKLGPN